MKSGPLRREAVFAGLAVGLGFFTKSTALLFAFFPVLAAFWWRRDRWKVLARQLALIYAIAAVFPVISWIGEPDVPTFETTNIVFHQSFFFAKPAELLAHPFAVAVVNFPLFFDYVSSYLTWPAFVGGSGGARLFELRARVDRVAAVFGDAAAFAGADFHPQADVSDALSVSAYLAAAGVDRRSGLQRLFEDLKQRWETPPGGSGRGRRR